MGRSSTEHSSGASISRQDAAASGIAIGPKTYRRFIDKPRGRRADAFKEHWEEMSQCLEANPDQTALELLIEFQARHPGRYSLHQLRTLQKRVRAWRQQAVQRLICEMKELPQSVSAIAPRAYVAAPHPTSGDPAASIPWFKGNIDAAFATVHAQNKPVFLFWGAVWCPYCSQDVFEAMEVAASVVEEILLLAPKKK